MVAPSFQSLTMISKKPYVGKTGKLYVKVLTKNGAEREVRWYSEMEYARSFEKDMKEKYPSNWRKISLGFSLGDITIFAGPADNYADWFAAKGMWWNKWFGYHCVSYRPLPSDIPADLIPIKVEWKDVSIDDATLKDDKVVIGHINSLKKKAEAMQR